MAAMILQAVGWPALACAAVLLAWARPWQVRSRPATCAPAVAVAVGYLAGVRAVAGSSVWQPSVATDWLGAVAILMAATPVLAGRRARPRSWTWAIDAAVAAACAYLVVRVPVHARWSATASATTITAIAAAILVTRQAFTTAAARVGPATTLAALGAAAAGSAGVLLLAGTALVGLLAAALAAAMGTTWTIDRLWPGRLDPRGVTPVATGLLVSSWAIALLFAELPPIAAAILGSIPALVVVLARLAPARLGRAWVIALTLVAVAAPLAAAAAVCVAHRGTSASTAASPNDYGYH